MTGYGVAESVRHFFDIYRQTTVSDKTAVIQGWGNVAGAAGYYLARQGVKIKGIIDRDYGIISKEGLTFEQVKLLFALRQNNSIQPDGLPKELSGKLLPFESINEKIWNINADIFIPGAASKLVSQSQLERLINNGLTVIACGANVPLRMRICFLATPLAMPMSIAALFRFYSQLRYGKVVRLFNAAQCRSYGRSHF